MPNNNEDSRKSSLRSHLHDFSGYTTLHGSYFVFGSVGIIRRLIWMVLVLSGLGICTRQVIVSFKKLQAYEDVVSKEIIPERKLPFPAFTFCNINMMKKSLINNTEAQIFLDKLNSIKREQSKKQLNDTFDIAEAVKKYGYSAENMVRVCVWDGQDGNKCSTADNFTTRLSYLYGQCHTFNSGQHGHPLLSSTSSERANGLLLVIEAAKEDDFYGLSSYFGSGIRVVVHDQHEQPNIERDGIDISKGSMTSIRIQRNEYNSLKAPYQSKCGSKKLETSTEYTRSTCLLECSTRKVIKKCGCKLLGMANITEFNHIKYCSPKEMISCGVYTMPRTDPRRDRTPNLIGVLSKLTFGYNLPNNPQVCGCPRPCKEIIYSTRIAVADNFITDSLIADAVAPIHIPIFKRISANMLHLSVYFEDLNRYVTTERPSYDINLFGADVGGYLGLFLGCSVLTVCEFIDLVLVCCFGRRHSKKNKEMLSNGRSASTNDDEPYGEEMKIGLFEPHNADKTEQ